MKDTRGRERWEDGLPEVPNRVLVRAFDYLAAAAFGTVASVAASFIVPVSWHLLIAMLMGMVVGAISTLPLLAVFSWILGGFELLVLSMQAGMLAGMVGAMTGPGSFRDTAFEGLLVGLLVQSLIHAADHALAGEVTRDG